MPRDQRPLPAEESWRMVDGDHDSFDTTLVPDLSFSSEDVTYPLSSGHSSSLGCSQNNPVPHSQDSIRDFAAHDEDEGNILREPFRPSLSARATSSRVGSALASGPELKMPVVDVDCSGPSSLLSWHTLRPLQGHPAGTAIQDLRSRARGFPGGPRKRTGSHASDAGRPPPRRSRGGRGAGPRSGSLRILDAAFGFFCYVRRPLAILLVVYGVVGSIVLLEVAVSSSALLALSPVCRIPGASILRMPFCLPSGLTNRSCAAEFDGLVEASARFVDGILETTVRGASLANDVLQSSAAVSDLRGLVESSDLDSKFELMPHLDAYVKDARELASGLARVGVAVGATLDNLHAIHRRTLRSITQLEGDDDDGRVPSALVGTVTWLSSPFRPAAHVVMEQKLRELYLEHASLVLQRVEFLLDQVTAVQRVLDDADYHISSIHEIATRFSDAITSRDLILYYLGNLLKDPLPFSQAALAKRLVLLRAFESHRAAAALHLGAIASQLGAMAARLEGLQEHVLGLRPSLLAGEHPAAAPPLTAHVHAVGGALERMERARVRISGSG